MHHPNRLSENKNALADLLAPKNLFISPSVSPATFINAYFGTEIQCHRKTSFYNPLPINTSAESIIIIIIQGIFAALCHNRFFNIRNTIMTPYWKN
jgi:hypothetical protein